MSGVSTTESFVTLNYTCLRSLDRSVPDHALAGSQVDRFNRSTVNHMANKHIDTYGQTDLKED